MYSAPLWWEANRASLRRSLDVTISRKPGLTLSNDLPCERLAGGGSLCDETDCERITRRRLTYSFAQLSNSELRNKS